MSTIKPNSLYNFHSIVHISGYILYTPHSHRSLIHIGLKTKVLSKYTFRFLLYNFVFSPNCRKFKKFTNLPRESYILSKISHILIAGVSIILLI